MHTCVACHAALEALRHRLGAQKHPIPLPEEDMKQTAARQRREILSDALAVDGHTNREYLSNDSDLNEEGSSRQGLQHQEKAIWL
jgi:hypothetical protein